MPPVFPNQFDINSHPIAESLIDWYSGAKRELPWRESNDPYDIWVSEIILQQTRVEQGLPYYLRFIESFPDVETLAAARENDVLANWQGLGYYSRARNMHFTAKHIVEKLNGEFPKTYSEILKLKGIGPYTAAAIASFCFGEPEPVVDGNVFRVASRLFGISDDIAEGKSRKKFESVLKEIIPHDQPGTFNQAIMEYGATVCLPSPSCERCVFTKECFAFQNDSIKELPVKSKKLKVKERDLNYLVLENEGRVLMKKRGGKDIWEGMFDFPELEARNGKVFSDPIIHLLSHQRLSVRFSHSQVSEDQFKELARTHGAEPYSIEQILTLPKPKVIVDFVEKTFGE